MSRSTSAQRAPIDDRALRRKHAIEATLIVGAVVVTFGLLTAMLDRLLADEEAAQPETTPKDERATANVLSEIPLGEFRTAVGAEPLSTSAGRGNRAVQVVQFEATVIVSGSLNDIIRAEDSVRAYRHRVRQLIDQTARGANEDELQEPSLWTLRTRMQDRLNGLFGAPIIEEMILGHFRRYELPQ